MKKKDRDDEIPENIDFSNAIRGKYVDRYREGISIHERQSIDPITFYEAQSRLGHALWHAQALEAACVAYISLVRNMAVVEAGGHAHALLEHHDRDILKNWRSTFDAEGLTDRQFQDRLARFIVERNWLVHRSSFELADQLTSPDRIQELTIRLGGFADEALYLSQSLFRVIELNLSKRGLMPTEIETRTKEVIEEWAEVH